MDRQYSPIKRQRIERLRERDTEDGQINEKETEGIGWNGF